MSVTITKLRQNIFQLADQALEGETVEFVHKGVVFRIVPTAKPSKLSKLTGQTVVTKGVDLEAAGAELLKEMEAEWQKDWSEL